ncbi:T9SS-dependent choice-of-anchor J family protein [Kaistella palustris]|uniref:T9SS-dependent choice-of-anchor J family protein n=1 Tax=Kaistella palustris TaxID=493376 RepID=UPI0004280B47|nr:choice-of-anchor J domain-containing protein [Kaistella palustris]
MKTKLLSLAAFAMLFFANAQTTLLSEGFNTVPVAGWTTTNQSTTVGSTGWFQGNTTVFNAQAGPATSYIGANFNNTTGANTISNWLITPQVMVQDGDVLKFWTRTTTGAPFADRLEVRSSVGATPTLPTGATGVGSFSNVHLTINPSLITGPTGYPDVWTEYTITVSGVSPTPVALNFAFRYFVTSGGPSGNNSNFIGIDTLSLVRPALAVSNTGKSTVSIYPNPTADYLNVNAASKVSKVEIFDISGKNVKAELVDGKVDVQNLAKGSYIIKITEATGVSSQKFIKK